MDGDRDGQASGSRGGALPRIDDAPPPRDFFQALSAPGPIKLIAEVKKASPSRGVIRSDFQPLDIAETYARHGAICLSVLTDSQYFQGSLEILSDVRRHVELPLLRKDFILDRYQLLEARAAGADAVLLIAECLDDCKLRSLHNECWSSGWFRWSSFTIRRIFPACSMREQP